MRHSIRFLQLGLVSLALPAIAVGGQTTGPPATLEDLFRDTGDRFQAAIGLLNLEGSSGNSATQGFGLAIDDMFVEWFEFVLTPDATSCASGQCAVIELPTGQIYEGVTSFPVSLLDASPYGFACFGGPHIGRRCAAAHGDADCSPGTCRPARNDCDLDGLFDGPDDDNDCDGDGIPDVVAVATSEVDPGERVVLNQVTPGSSEYRGTLSVSVLADSEGVLFLSQIGEASPTVTVTYDDNDDGTGDVCRNGVIPENQGRVQTFAIVNVQACDVQLVATSFTDNGDGDLYADSSETISLDFDVRNNCGFLLTNCVARLSSASPEVECIKQGTVVLGSLPSPASGVPPIVPSPSSFVLKLDDDLADRTTRRLGPSDPLAATFNIAISCDQIDGLRTPQSFALSLDLNLNDDGQLPTPWLESFEGGGVNPADPFDGTQFRAQDNDHGIPGSSNAEGLINGDGWRCQYVDPDWVNSATYNQASALDCFPGISLAQANAVWWAIDGTGIPNTPDGGRAFRGTRSMYYGIFLNEPQDDFTTPMSLVEAAGTNPVINLGAGDPKLSFWHQISIADHRWIQAPDRRSADRGALQIQLVDEGGAVASPWMNLQALQNGYDEQAADNFFGCSFDPIDDGNTEDDFFDPTDPDRDLGPSSTCFPEFTWAWMGSTTGVFNVANVGHATTPPASSDAPALGDGTWIETVVDLGPFRGRRARLRFIVTSIKSSAENYFEQFGDNNEGDDGWWIDEIEIDEVLARPASLDNDDYTLGHCSVDTTTSCIAQCKFSGATCRDDGECGVSEPCIAPCPSPQLCLPVPPACGETCTEVTANAFVTPAGVLNPGDVTTAAPGQALGIQGAAAFDIDTGAMPSSADACLSGSLQFRFCRDGDPLGGGPSVADGDCDDPGDLLMRSWTENAVLTIAPQESAGYTMQVRCSTQPDCLDAEIVNVEVICPGADNALGLASLFAVFDSAENRMQLRWLGSPLDVDVWTSDTFTNSSQLASYPGTTSVLADANAVDLDALSPPAGYAVGLLVKAEGALNTIPSGFYCNSRTWRSGGVSEIPETGGSGRDTSIGDPTP